MAAAQGIGALADQLVTTVNADIDTENSTARQAYAGQSIASGGTVGRPGYGPSAMTAYLSRLTA